MLVRQAQTSRAISGEIFEELGFDLQEHLAYTLEPPWRQNKPESSCIPAGEYRCQLVQSPHFGKVYEVRAVPGRDHILIHWGNFPKDTHGCILLGNTRSRDAVWHSNINEQSAFPRFMKLLGGEPFLLTIKDL